MTQFFAVVRHAERGDSLFAFTDGHRWCDTEDFREHPLDPPLSDFGREQSVDIGAMLKERAEEADAPIHVVISSPYLRCIQTAASIVKANPGVRLLIDRSLGEVFGPCVMGQNKPDAPVRPLADALKQAGLCAGPSSSARMIGKWPTWPEELSNARMRFACRFLRYLHRGSRAKRNFILVTHGDCVGAALAMMPSQVNTIISAIDYGGLFLATRSLRSKARLRKICTSDSFMDDTADALTGEDHAGSDSESCASPHGLRIRKSRTSTSGWSATSDERQEVAPEPPASSDGWEVEVRDIQVRHRVDAKAGSRIKKSLKKLVRASTFSSNRIEELLGKVLESGLSSDEDELENPGRHTAGDYSSECSRSTYLFGASVAEGSLTPKSDFALSPMSLASPALRRFVAASQSPPLIGAPIYDVNNKCRTPVSPTTPHVPNTPPVSLPNPCSDVTEPVVTPAPGNVTKEESPPLTSVVPMSPEKKVPEMKLESRLLTRRKTMGAVALNKALRTESKEASGDGGYAAHRRRSAQVATCPAKTLAASAIKLSAQLAESDSAFFEKQAKAQAAAISLTCQSLSMSNTRRLSDPALPSTHATDKSSKTNKCGDEACEADDESERSSKRNRKDSMLPTHEHADALRANTKDQSVGGSTRLNSQNSGSWQASDLDSSGGMFE